MAKNTEKNTERPQNKNLRPPWKKGDPSPNPKGHPKGQKNYATLQEEAIRSYGKRNKMTEEEIELLIHEHGIDQAIKGDYNFFRDYMDRTHGKPKDTIDFQGEVKISKLEEIQQVLVKSLKK
jgi:hypothetical protein